VDPRPQGARDYGFAGMRRRTLGITDDGDDGRLAERYPMAAQDVEFVASMPREPDGRAAGVSSGRHYFAKVVSKWAAVSKYSWNVWLKR
jgi:hypothetical protein